MHTFSLSLAKVMTPYHSPNVKAATHLTHDSSRAYTAQNNRVQVHGPEAINDRSYDDYVLTDLTHGDAQVHIEPLDMRLGADQQMTARLSEDDERMNAGRDDFEMTSLEHFRDEHQQLYLFERELTPEMSVIPSILTYDPETFRSSKVLNNKKNKLDERSELDNAGSSERIDSLLISSNSQGIQDCSDKRSNTPTLASNKPKDATSIILPPCRICGAKASGFHYGVNSCEACKGFFRRALKRPMVFYCTKNKTCDVKGNKRSSCRFCRYKRCLSLGMSREAIKTGRYSHKKRTKDTIEVKRLQNTPNAITDASEMDSILKALFEAESSLKMSTKHTPEHALYMKQLEYNNAYTLHKKFRNSSYQKVCHENQSSVDFLGESFATTQCCGFNSRTDHERKFLMNTNLPEKSNNPHNLVDKVRDHSKMYNHGRCGLDNKDTRIHSKKKFTDRSEDKTKLTSEEQHDDLRSHISMATTQTASGLLLRSMACTSGDSKTLSDVYDHPLRGTRGTEMCNKESGRTRLSEISGSVSLLDIGKIKPAGYFNLGDVNLISRHVDNRCSASHRDDTSASYRGDTSASYRGDTWASLPESPKASLPEIPMASLPQSPRASLLVRPGMSVPVRPGASVLAHSKVLVPDGPRLPVQDSEIRKVRNGKTLMESCEAWTGSRTDVIARAENWVMGYIDFAKAIPGFSSLPPQDQASLLRHAWDEVWILGAYRGYNCELGVAVMPSGKCFHSEEMEWGWGRGYARLAFDLASILKRQNLTSNLVTLLKAICIVSPDRCDLINKRGVEDMQWVVVACLLHHIETTYPSDRTIFPRLVSILTSLRELSQSAQSTMDSASVDAVFGCSIASDIFAPF